jgi:endonuclease/exonuclease/phosphatase family metal-dependent hydrolase
LGSVAVRVLTWNLKHGRAVPSAGRELLHEFTTALASWEWDVALLQEVPPWWPAPLAERLDAQQRLVLTSRNALLPLRQAVARRWPDVIKSNGGGANAILARGGSVEEHRARRLCLVPERRWVHGVRLGDTWFANLHTAAELSQAQLAAATLRVWAGGQPIVLGGDFNLRSLSLEEFAWVAGHHVDHIFASRLSAASPVDVLDHGRLSDHAPVAVAVG